MNKFLVAVGEIIGIIKFCGFKNGKLGFFTVRVYLHPLVGLKIVNWVLFNVEEFICNLCRSENIQLGSFAVRDYI